MHLVVVQNEASLILLVDPKCLRDISGTALDIPHQDGALGVHRGQQMPMRGSRRHYFFLVVVDYGRVAEIRTLQIPYPQGLVRGHSH